MNETITQQEQWYADGLQFSCNQCGNCCTGPSGYVWVDRGEQVAMAEHFGLTLKEFRKKYARKLHGRWSLNEVQVGEMYDCVFLDRNSEGGAGCSIYGLRPVQCRTWPFWPENLRSLRSYVTAGRTCPGMTRGLRGEGKSYSLTEIRVLRDQTPAT